MFAVFAVAVDIVAITSIQVSPFCESRRYIFVSSLDF